jgi:heme/copper-type cytochrome/quinol oxidase subunit 2
LTVTTLLFSFWFDIMGIHDFLPRYYGGDKFWFGFTSLCFRSVRIVLDVAGLLFACATRHSDSYAIGDYTPALQDM